MVSELLVSQLASPVLWPHPQWAVSHDELDLGRVAPGAPAQKAVLLANVGGGPQTLSCTLHSSAPWLELRRGEAAPWESTLEVRLQAGEELLILVRANPDLSSQVGGQSAQILVDSPEAGIANAPETELNARGRLDLAPIRVKAYFLEAKFLTLQDAQITETGGQTTVEHSQNERGAQIVSLRSVGVPLGQSPSVRFRIGRSDGLPPRCALDLCEVSRGKRQWFDCLLQNRGDEQFLELKFFTANRQPGQTHVLEFLLHDSADLVEPAMVRWQIEICAPPILSFSPLQMLAVASRPTQAELELKNEGQSELSIQYARVPGEFASWLALDKNLIWPLKIGAGESQKINVGVVGKALQPGQTVGGHLEISCNHMGRQVVRRVPVVASVPTHGVRVEVADDSLEVVLNGGCASEIPLQIYNEGATPAVVRVAVVDETASQETMVGTWLSCDTKRLSLPAGTQTATAIQVSAVEIPTPAKVASYFSGVAMVVLVSTQGETQIWSRRVTLRVQPKPKRFGLF